MLVCLNTWPKEVLVCLNTWPKLVLVQLSQHRLNVEPTALRATRRDDDAEWKREAGRSAYESASKKIAATPQNDARVLALTDRLLVSFIGPFACSRAITGRKSGYSFDTEHTVACASRQRLREVSPPFLLFSSFLPFFFPSLLPRLRRGSFIFYFLQH